MSITKQECAEIRVEKRTWGGATYHIRKHDFEEFEKLCFRPARGKKNSKVVDKYSRLIRCDYQAGRNTDHLGFGACSRHGGGGKGQIIGAPHLMIHGKSSFIKQTLSNKITNYYENDKINLHDLSFELASVRAIFQAIIEEIPELESEDFPGTLYKIIELVGTIGTLVDKISRIESRNAVTVAQILYFRTVVAAILMKYITNPEDRELAAKELTQQVGGVGEYARVV